MNNTNSQTESSTVEHKGYLCPKLEDIFEFFLCNFL